LVTSLLIVLSFILSYSLVVRVVPLIVLITVLLMLTSGVYVWIRGRKSARFFVFAWITLILGALLVSLRNMGVLPDNFFTRNTILFGSMFEVLLISFALGDRISLYRKEKEEAQGKLLEASKEKERMIANRNLILEQKVEERTQEVQAKEVKIRKLYEDLSGSIHYAQGIQDTILPIQEKFASLLPHSFVFFKPRDVVSGDFYFLEEVDNKIILAAIDCTGHGVPGAFMSLIGNDILTEIIINQKITEPHKILEKLHLGVRALLRQEETKNRDGMDMSLVVIDKGNKILEFAGAKNPLIYIQNDKLKTIKGDKMPIGGEQREENFHKTLY